MSISDQTHSRSQASLLLLQRKAEPLFHFPFSKIPQQLQQRELVTALQLKTLDCLHSSKNTSEPSPEMCDIL